MSKELQFVDVWEKVFNAVSPDMPAIKRDLSDFLNSHKPKKLNERIGYEINKIINSSQYKKKMSEMWADEIVSRYAKVGAASALPSLIPGLGPVAQIGTEVATVGADLALMLRYMYTIVVGIGLINGRDMETNSNRDLLKTLGIWCGALKPVGETIVRLSSKAAVVAFNKYVPGKIFQAINRKVGTTILTKWGTKRGGIALGKAIPFLIGPLAGGIFNYATMKGFKETALKHLSCEEVIIEEDI